MPIGLSLLTLVLALQAHSLLQERDAARQQLASLESIEKRDRQAVKWSSHDVDTTTLPTGPEAAAVLATLATASQHLGLGLGEVSSAIEREPGNKRLRQSLDFQVQGSFKAIVSLAAEMLGKHQSLALDSINAERIDGAGPVLTASLRFSLFIEP